MSSPPESKQTPFPTNAIYSSELGFPLYAILANTGSLELALPTA